MYIVPSPKVDIINEFVVVDVVSVPPAKVITAVAEGSFPAASPTLSIYPLAAVPATLPSSSNVSDVALSPCITAILAPSIAAPKLSTVAAASAPGEKYHWFADGISSGTSPTIAVKLYSVPSGA